MRFANMIVAVGLGLLLSGITLAALPWECNPPFQPAPFTCFVSSLADLFPFTVLIFGLLVIGLLLVIIGLLKKMKAANHPVKILES